MLQSIPVSPVSMKPQVTGAFGRPRKTGHGGRREGGEVSSRTEKRSWKMSLEQTSLEDCLSWKGAWESSGFEAKGKHIEPTRYLARGGGRGPHSETISCTKDGALLAWKGMLERPSVVSLGLLAGSLEKESHRS